MICIAVAGCSRPPERPYDDNDVRAVLISCQDSIALWHERDWEKLRKFFYPGTQFATLSPPKEARLFQGMYSRGIDAEADVQAFRRAVLPKEVLEALIPFEFRGKGPKPLTVTFRLGSRQYWQIWAKTRGNWFLLLPPLDLDDGTVAELKARLKRTN